MRPELEEIKYIEDYLLNKLSPEQKGEFEKRVKSDPEFAQKVKLQKVLLKRVNRLSLKHTVAQAHRKHTQRNTFMFKRNKNFFKSFISLILVLVVAYLIYLSDQEVNEQKNELDSLKQIPVAESVLKQKIDNLKETPFRFPIENSLGNKYEVNKIYSTNKSNNNIIKGIEIYNSSPPVSSFTDTIISIGHGYAMAFVENNLTMYYKHKNSYIKTVFYNCDTVLCKAGDFINKGQAIATFGRNSRSLHIEMSKEKFDAKKNDEVEFIDPAMIMPVK